jgi:hypothetical protein
LQVRSALSLTFPSAGGWPFSTPSIPFTPTFAIGRSLFANLGVLGSPRSDRHFDDMRYSESGTARFKMEWPVCPLMTGTADYDRERGGWSLLTFQNMLPDFNLIRDGLQYVLVPITRAAAERSFGETLRDRGIPRRVLQ